MRLARDYVTTLAEQCPPLAHSRQLLTSQTTVTLVPGEVLAQVIGVAGHLCRIGSPFAPPPLHPRRPLQGSELFLAPTSCVIVLTLRCCGFTEFGNHRCLFTFGLV
ncbi:hypothetical protein TNCV_2705341 [Trichonephila clavipes]|nr:hypothetical protein TNCV_2705341 [Trichonephila clavipes]